MSERKWAAIVYGRSYHLDFRFIAVPEDFTEREVTWASKYIFATTRKARKLPAYPRWSLFKNEFHCVTGVTCMVRDLTSSIDLSGKIPTKDNRGRPLYIFVGYVTQLNGLQYPLDLPPYTEDRLQNFANLYRYVSQVWTVKDYSPDSKKPFITNYQKITFSTTALKANSALKAKKQLNHEQKSPDRVFLWQNNLQHNLQLWNEAAFCPQSLSLCLNINSKQYFANSPFLNQTLTGLEGFAINERVVTKNEHPPKPEASSRSLSTAIANKVKNDLEITIYHANHAAILGQELVENFTEWTQVKPISEVSQSTEAKPPDNFGFKHKKSSEDNSDWF